jgi:hypothetical protein
MRRRLSRKLRLARQVRPELHRRREPYYLRRRLAEVRELLTMARKPVKIAFLLSLLGLVAWSTDARAQSTIKQPGARPAYYFEAEPHLLAGLLDPPGFGAGTGLGLGFRGTIELAKDGFLPKLNDSVGIGFGLDWLRYDGWDGPRNYCQERITGPAGVPICLRAPASGGSIDYFYLPVVLQWNFWLHRKWSVFGEPGLAMYVEDGDVELTPFVLYAGGRFHLTDRVALTLRVGYPTFSFGASFLL